MFARLFAFLLADPKGRKSAIGQRLQPKPQPHPKPKRRFEAITKRMMVEQRLRRRRPPR